MKTYTHKLVLISLLFSVVIVTAQLSDYTCQQKGGVTMNCGSMWDTCPGNCTRTTYAIACGQCVEGSGSCTPAVFQTTYTTATADCYPGKTACHCSTNWSAESAPHDVTCGC